MKEWMKQRLPEDDYIFYKSESENIVHKNRKTLIIVENLFYFSQQVKVGGASAIKINKFILYCARLALPLRPKTKRKIVFLRKQDEKYKRVLHTGKLR